MLPAVLLLPLQLLQVDILPWFEGMPLGLVVWLPGLLVAPLLLVLSNGEIAQCQGCVLLHQCLACQQVPHRQIWIIKVQW